MLMRRVHWYNTSTTISVGHRHTGALNKIEEKRRFEKRIRHLKRSNKKLDEDAQRCEKVIPIIYQYCIKS